MNPHLKSAIIRAIRTYIAVAAPAILAAATDSGPFDWNTWKVALASGVPAAISFLWRAVLDPSDVPSLPDKTPAA